MKSLIILLVITLTIPGLVNAQSEFAIQWQGSYGGLDDDRAESIQHTNDGGFIIAGYTFSDDSIVIGNHGVTDALIVKTDATGKVEWQKCYGGSSWDVAYSIIQANDGGYIFACETQSSDGDVTGQHGQQDIWIVKIDPYGIIQWKRCYGGSGYETVKRILQTPDGGYIVAGSATSNDGDVTNNHGEYDYWIVKIDFSGAIQWQNCYGGSDFDVSNGISFTTEGGYIIAGFAASTNGDVTGNHGGNDFWVIKTDQSGVIQWQKCYGGSNDDVALGVWQQPNDGGYYIYGTTSSTDGNVTSNHGVVDYWVVKTDPVGNIQWQKSYGGSHEDFLRDAQQTLDGGYILCGSSQSYDGDVTGNHGSEDYWVVKTDASGNIQWQKSYGGSSSEEAHAIYQSLEGHYMVVGFSYSIDGDILFNHGFSDFWLIGLCNNDPLTVAVSDTIYCNSTNLIASSGFVSYLWNTGETTQTIEVEAGGVYSVMAVNTSGCPSESAITIPDPIQPFYGENICLVTMDSTSGKNVIVIEKTINVGIDSIHIYRMDNINSQYEVIGTIGINDLSIFTDEDAIPFQQSYQYKISIKDTCGKESELSESHRTILLQANAGINREVNLYWNPYTGFEYPNFEIYRKTGTRSDFMLIANVPNNTYAFTDLNPPSGTNYYQVRVTKANPCVPSRSVYGHVGSNIINSSTIGIGEVERNSITISPNPANDRLTVKVGSNWVGSDYSITDPRGKKLLTGNLANAMSTITISELSPGIYLFRFGEQNEKVMKIIKK